MQRVFVLLIVSAHQLGSKRCVKKMAAALAPEESYITGRCRERLGTRRPQHIAVDGYRRHLNEQRRVGRVADWTGLAVIGHWTGIRRGSNPIPRKSHETSSM